MKEDVKTNISEEEIVLAPPTELFDEAKDIAQNTTAGEKFPFALQYDANQKEILLSLLQTVGAIVENDDEEGHVLATMMNMTQLAFIKRLDCVERVRTDEGRNPFLAEEAVSPEAVEAETPVETPVETVAQQNVETAQTEQVMTLAADESVAVAAEPLAVIADDSNAANDGIAVANVYNTSSSCCCPTNKDMASAKEIQIETTVYGNICCPGAEQWFKFTVPKDATYTIYTTESLDTVGTLYDCCGNQIVEVDDYAPCGKINFRIIRYLTANTTYYLRVTEAKSDTGSYTLKITENALVKQVIVSSENGNGVIVLKKGETYQLPRGQGYDFLENTGMKNAPVRVTLSPSNATERRVSWYISSSTNVADKGTTWYNDTTKYEYIVAKEVGGTRLYADDYYDHGKNGMVYVAVSEDGNLVKAEGINLSSTNLNLNVGDYEYLTATVYPETATVKNVVWRSADSSIATVTSFGRVKAIRPGRVRIIAESMDGAPLIEASCEVTVINPSITGIPVKVKCSNGLTVMSAASGGSILGTFANGEELLLINETPQNGHMFHVYGIMTNNYGKYGWCSGEYLEKETIFLKSICQDNINVRSGPGTNYDKIGLMSYGFHFPLLEANSESGSGYWWHKILYNGVVGYVSISTVSEDYEIVSKRVLLAYGCCNISEEGISMLKRLEGYSSVAYKPFEDETFWTIGYGHLIAEGGNTVKINGVSYAMLTEDLADTLLRNDMAEVFIPRFNNFLHCNNVRLNQYQYDACIMDAYQKGQNIWQSGTRSIVKFILDNQDFNNYEKVLIAFIDGATKNGWINRRTKEANLFVNNIYS